MILADPVPGSTITQRFGPAVAAVAKLEPPMWVNGDRAYWTRFAGSHFVEHYHPGEDRFGPLGTPVLAREAGIVQLAEYRNSVSGNAVRVEIRPGVSRYGVNHLLKWLVKPGDHVVKGQTIGLLGHSGSVSPGLVAGVAHLSVEIYEKGIGWVCYNPVVFQPGGRLQNDNRIQPVVVSVADLVILKGPGINIRLTPDFDVGPGNIYAISKADGTPDGGIYERTTGKLIHSNIKTGFLLRRTISNDDGTWVEVWGFNQVLFIYKSLVDIIVR